MGVEPSAPSLLVPYQKKDGRFSGCNGYFLSLQKGQWEVGRWWSWNFKFNVFFGVVLGKSRSHPNFPGLKGPSPAALPPPSPSLALLSLSASEKGRVGVGGGAMGSRPFHLPQPPTAPRGLGGPGPSRPWGGGARRGRARVGAGAGGPPLFLSPSPRLRSAKAAAGGVGGGDRGVSRRPWTAAAFQSQTRGVSPVRVLNRWCVCGGRINGGRRRAGRGTGATEATGAAGEGGGLSTCRARRAGDTGAITASVGADGATDGDAVTGRGTAPSPLLIPLFRPLLPRTRRRHRRDLSRSTSSPPLSEAKVGEASPGGKKFIGSWDGVKAGGWDAVPEGGSERGEGGGGGGVASALRGRGGSRARPGRAG